MRTAYAPHVPIEEPMTTRQWWESRRKIYNGGLIAAQVLAFYLYLSLLNFHGTRVLEDDIIELSALGLFFFWWAFPVPTVLANLCYYLGPFAERVVEPRNVNRYRRITFWMGFVFSMLLPFLLPCRMVLIAGMIE